MGKTVLMQHDTAAYGQYFAAVEERLAEGQEVVLAFGGRSMYPTLRGSDRLRFVSVAKREVEVGDVVLFRHEGMYKVHRVKHVRVGRYTMQGDNCYGVEHATKDDIVAVLVGVERLGPTDGAEWMRVSRRALLRNRVKNFVIRWMGSRGRQQLRPWYFLLLAVFMWAPLGGFGQVMDSFVFGIRLDHLLHASVFVPATLFLMDVSRSRWLVWLLGVVMALFCEGLQYVIPYRAFDVNDVVANVFGVTLGWVVILFCCRRGVRRQRRYPDRGRL